ncbi:MAG: hypothetical protein OXG96_00455 [Acidobacteria bacterium]|nr:hypothetical protein [Acidobacteriota bacterium]
MAATCPKCLAELPRQLLWKALKSGTLDKAEVTCPQCQQVLRIVPKSLATILALALLPEVAILLWCIFFLVPHYPPVVVVLVLLALIPLTFVLLMVFYFKLVRFREKPPGYSIRG